MSFEIYYTSAPEGLKPGTSGFATVAATDAIPKQLWDRLESLSAYRHQFGAQEAAGAAGGNPVSLAHWMLTIAGRTHHVLSRICDAGVDHTHRTNAFAHHLVADPAEMAAATGGPAWLLSQAGVMASSWNGSVGPLPTRKLPGGDSFAPRICAAWQQATGDAGWGGHLADLFTKTPTRPVCILFAPGQDVFPLLAETIALLPATLRWKATFNTYFTSMPTSATCAWRCCLAGTPAAQVGLQYAANGLIINLAEPSRLGVVPAGPLVEAARTGHLPQSAAPASKPAPGRPAAAAASTTKAAPNPLPSAAELDDGEEEEMERRRAAILESPIESGPAPAPEERSVGELDFADVASRPTPVRGHRKLPSVRDRDDALRQADSDAEVAAAARRRQIMLLLVGAVGAIAVGMGLVWWSTSNALPPEPNIVPTARPNEEPAPPPTPQEPIAQQEPTPAPVPFNPTPAPPPVDPAPVPANRIPKPPPPPPPAPAFPDVVALSGTIDKPDIGTGLGERRQTLSFKTGELEAASAIKGLSLRIGPPSADPAAPRNTYGNTQLGILTAVAAPGPHPTAALKWKAPGDPTTGPGNDVVLLELDKSKGQVDIVWKPALLLKQPNLLPYTYWILQSADLVLESNRAKPQLLVFKNAIPEKISLTTTGVDFNWAVDPPAEATPAPPPAAALPMGWTATWYPTWETKESALRSPANALQVIHFKKPTGNGEAWFLITFRPGLSHADCTFAQRRDADKSDLDKAQAELQAVEAKLAEYTAANGGKLPILNATNDLKARQEVLTTAVNGLKNAAAAYAELQSFDLGFDLSDGFRLATLKYRQPETGK